MKMDDVQTSPVIEKKEQQETMSFPDALRELASGKRITRISWGMSDEYGLLEDGYLSIHRSNGNTYRWLVNDGDLIGEDWIVVE
jgi:hypothetical protein